MSTSFTPKCSISRLFCPSLILKLSLIVPLLFSTAFAPNPGSYHGSHIRSVCGGNKHPESIHNTVCEPESEHGCSREAGWSREGNVGMSSGYGGYSCLSIRPQSRRECLAFMRETNCSLVALYLSILSAYFRAATVFS
jgi:hypothetical protein